MLVITLGSLTCAQVMALLGQNGLWLTIEAVKMDSMSVSDHSGMGNDEGDGE